MPPFIDLTGQRFGKLVVIKKLPTNKNQHDARWLCQCDCGNDTAVNAGHLRRLTITSCGCGRRKSPVNFKDITGNRYGKLVVVERLEKVPTNHNNKKAWWKCKCDCGNETVVDGAMLRYGVTKSCGCSKYLPKGEAAFNALYYVYKTSHQRRREQLGTNTKERAVFTLAKDKFQILTKQNCFYCGKEPSTTKKAGNGDYVYNGIDRIDNAKGYTIDNVVTCCSECNFYKGSKTQDEFISWIKRIANHWKPE